METQQKNWCLRSHTGLHRSKRKNRGWKEIQKDSMAEMLLINGGCWHGVNRRSKKYSEGFSDGLSGLHETRWQNLLKSMGTFNVVSASSHFLLMNNIIKSLFCYDQLQPL